MMKSLIAFLLVALLAATPATASQIPPEWQSAAQAVIGELEREESKKTVAEKMPFLKVMRQKDVLLLCLTYFGGTCGNYGLNLWLPKIIQKVGSFDAVTTSWISAIPAIAAINAVPAVTAIDAVPAVDPVAVVDEVVVVVDRDVVVAAPAAVVAPAAAPHRPHRDTDSK